MATISENAERWVRWCHADQPMDSGEASLASVAKMVAHSPYPDPVVMVEMTDASTLVRGYAIACEGAIGFLGKVRIQGGGASFSRVMPTMIGQLCRASLAKGVELVQAIVPVPDGSDHLAPLRHAFESAGMVRAATLLQLECCDIPFRQEYSPISKGADAPLEFVPYDAMPWQAWCRLVESTYVATQDVPILNGVRSIEATLRGYAVGQDLDELPWWSLYRDSVPVGCLMLSRLHLHDCELTYLGLVPEVRGLGHGHEILDFVGDWMLAQSRQRVLLAVDAANVPALQLYCNYGFELLGRIEAWIATREGPGAIG